MKKPYKAPKVYELGSVEEMTQGVERDKCFGRDDLAYPQDLSPFFAGDCPEAG